MALTKTIELYSPHPMQLQFHNSKARYRVAALGRQSGKSTMCLNELIAQAWEKPGTKYWYVSPTHEQAKQQYRRLVGMLSPCWEVLIKKNQSELRVKVINQSEIIFKSGESLDNLRGETLHGVVIDEVRDQHAELWPLVIRPMLTTTQGWAAFVSTPAGFDSFYDLYQKAETIEGWAAFQSPSTCNPLFTKEEYEAAKREMSEGEFAQEILAEFRDLTSGKAYLNHSRASRSTQCPFASSGQWSPHLPIIVGMDFNVGSMCWELMQNRHETWWVGDEIALENSHTQEAAKVLIERVRDHKPGVLLVGDATGSARKSSASGDTDYSIIMRALKDAGIKFENRTPDSNPSVKDRVNTVNGRLRNAEGQVNLFYDPDKCKWLARDFDRVVWKPSGVSAILDQSKDTKLTHASDAVGYPIMELSNLWKPSPGIMRVLAR